MKNIYLLIVLALFSISCTQQVIETDGSSEFGSRVAIPDDGSTEVVITENGTTITADKLAICSPIESDVNGFSAIMLGHQKNNLYVDDQMRLYIQKLPAGITSGANYIQFFKESTISGVSLTNPNPVIFKFMNSFGQELDTTTPITQLSQASMQTAIEESGLDVFYKNTSNIDYTPAHLMNQYEVLLTGLDQDYKSVRTAFYTGSTSAPTLQIATLIPAYIANPNDYATDTLSSYLAGLHPMNDRKNSGLTDAQFKSEIEDDCRSL